MGKKKIVLDTNILISAIGWNGKSREIFRRILNMDFELIISQKQIEELKRVLNYPKFGFRDEQKLRFLRILTNTAIIVKTSGKLRFIKEDPDDNMIIESAFENNADFIVSGDEHILKLKKFGKVKIVTASEFLELID